MFSVLIPAYNHRAFLSECVLSAVKSVLVSEVLIVDDGSMDDSRALFPLIRKIDSRIRILEEYPSSNRGAPTRLNQLAEAARCEWLSVLNSDDLFAAGRFEAIIRTLTRRRADLLFGDLVIIDGNGTRQFLRNSIRHNEIPWPADWAVDAVAHREDWLTLLGVQNIIATTSNMVFNKQIFRKVGGFRNYRYCHDWDFAIRCAVEGKISYAPLMLSMYRSHPANTIKEARRGVEREVCQMFRNLLQDYPELRLHQGFVDGVQFNPYIRPSLCWPLVVIMPPSRSLDLLRQATSEEDRVDVNFVERREDVPIGSRYIYAPTHDPDLLGPNELRNIVLAIAVRPYDAFLISRTPEPYPVVGAASLGDLTVWRADAEAGWITGNVRVLRSYTATADPRPIGELVNLANASVDTALAESPAREDWKPTVAVAHTALGLSGNMLPVVFILPAFLALGGVERVIIDTMGHIGGKYRFVIITSEPLRPEQGNLHREAVAYAHVYDLAEIVRVEDRLSALELLKDWYSPALVWICNGSQWQIEHSMSIREIFYDVPIVDNQAYDHEQGWIQHYNHPGVRAADRFVAINQGIRQAMISRYGIPAEQIDLVYPGFNPRRTQRADIPGQSGAELRTRFGLPATFPVYGMVGRLNPQKRPLDLVLLAERLQNVNYPAHLVWVGSGELEPDFTALVGRLGLRNITLIPAQEDIRPVFAMLGGLVITSEFEGLPVAMLEALSMGVPVLSTDVGAIGEVLERYGSGILFGPVGDIDALEQAFHRFVGCVETLHRRAVESSPAIAEDFSSVRMACEYNLCFAKAIAHVRSQRLRRSYRWALQGRLV